MAAELDKLRCEMVEKSEQLRVSGQGKNAEYLPLFSGITFDQIAFHPDQITGGTKVFIGPLVYYDSEGELVRIFDKLKNVKNIYTSFPDGRIERAELQIGGNSHEYLMKQLSSFLLVLDSHGGETHYPKFETLKEAVTIVTIKIKVRDLGLQGKPTIIEINARAQELGLELCRAEVAAYKRLDDYTQPKGSFYFIGMEPIVYLSSTIFKIWVPEDDDKVEVPKYRVAFIDDLFFANDLDNEYVYCLPTPKN